MCDKLGQGLQAVAIHARSHLVDGGGQIRQGSHLQLQGLELGARSSCSSTGLCRLPLCLPPAAPELEQQAGAIGDLLGGLQ